MTNTNWAELVVAIILLIHVMSGYRRGFLRTIYHMIKFIVAMILSAFLTPLIVTCLPASVAMPQVVAYIISFIMINILLGIIENVLGFVDHIPVIRQVNKVLGGAAGLLQGLLFVWILMSIILMAKTSPDCARFAGYIRHSSFLSLINQYNPVTWLLKCLGISI